MWPNPQETADLCMVSAFVDIIFNLKNFLVKIASSHNCFWNFSIYEGRLVPLHDFLFSKPFIEILNNR